MRVACRRRAQRRWHAVAGKVGVEGECEFDGGHQECDAPALTGQKHRQEKDQRRLARAGQSDHVAETIERDRRRRLQSSAPGGQHAEDGIPFDRAEPREEIPGRPAFIGGVFRIEDPGDLLEFGDGDADRSARGPVGRRRRRGRKGGDVARVADDVRTLVAINLETEGSRRVGGDLGLERRREDARNGSEHRSAPQVVLRYPFAHGEARRRIGRYLEGRFDVVVGRPVILLPGAGLHHRFLQVRVGFDVDADQPQISQRASGLPERWMAGDRTEAGQQRRRGGETVEAEDVDHHARDPLRAERRNEAGRLFSHAASVSTTVPTFANSTGSEPR